MTTKKEELILPNLLVGGGLVVLILAMLTDKAGAWLGIGLILLGIIIYFLQDNK